MNGIVITRRRKVWPHPLLIISRINPHASENGLTALPVVRSTGGLGSGSDSGTSDDMLQI